MFISNRCIVGLMPILIKKSVTVSNMYVHINKTILKNAIQDSQDVHPTQYTHSFEGNKNVGTRVLKR